MSRLSVYWPDEANSLLAATDESMILPFPKSRIASRLRFQPQEMDVVTRARVLYANRSCQDCGYPVVEPIELHDSAVNMSGLSIPGTATLVGFRCHGCQNEWSV